MSRLPVSASPVSSLAASSTSSVSSSRPAVSSSATRRVSTNRILSALSDEDYVRIAPDLRPVKLHLEHILCHRGERMKRVYFIEQGLISLVLTSSQGTDVEVGLVGPEGVAGGLAAVTDSVVMAELIVQTSGSAMAMPVAAFREEFARGGPMQKGVLLHAQQISVQAAQVALCNRLHTIEERLARWLLMVHDRVQEDRLELTQEFIANMLGSRRSGVTIAAGALRKAGLIEYTRGKVAIADRAGLEDVACECYSVIRDKTDSSVG